MDLYHYTSPDGHKGIKKSKVINASTDTHRDAAFGEGVYLTSLPPNTQTRKLHVNNYDGMTYQPDKFSHVVKVKIPADDPRLEKVEGIDRDVYRYDGDLPLKQYSHSSSKVPHKK